MHTLLQLVLISVSYLRCTVKPFYDYMELLFNCSSILMAIYLFSLILKFTQYSIKLNEKLSRRYLINSSFLFAIDGFTAINKNLIIVICQPHYIARFY